jgi:para-nitrobenzyl esterase
MARRSAQRHVGVRIQPRHSRPTGARRRPLRRLPYVFGFFPKTGNIAGHFGKVDTDLAELIDTYWTNFAKTGNPNSPGLPNWPQQGETGAYIQFQQDGKVDNASGLRSAQCGIYREWLTSQFHSAKAN